MKISLSDVLFSFQKQKYQHVRVADRQMGLEDDTELFCLHKNHANTPGDTVSQSQEKKKEKPRTGYEWRHGATICLAATVAILLLNVILTAVAASRAENPSFEAEAIFEGDCGRTKYWSTTLHVLINIFGTVLLGASNYCMQCLNAPSRQDVDRMRATGKWLDVGTPSIANLLVMKWEQVSLWCLLFLSSLPFHMLYNSAVFSTMTSNAYGIALVSLNVSVGSVDSSTDSCYEKLVGTDPTHIQSMYRDGEFETLSKEACIKAYGVPFLSNRRTLLLVSDNSSIPSPGIWVGVGNPTSSTDDDQDPFGWMCDSPGINYTFQSSNCLQSAVLEQIDMWAVTAQPFTTNTIVVAALDGSFAFTASNYSDLQGTSLPHHVQSDINTLGASLEVSEGFNTVKATWDLLHSQDWETPSFASTVTVYDSHESCASPSGMTIWPQYYPIEYCLSQQVKERCQLMYSPSICMVVIIFNLIKVICILLTIGQRRPDLFLTVGDAISSFLKCPDRTSLCQSWVDQKNIKRTFSRAEPVKSGVLPPQRRWLYAVGWRRLTVTIFCYLSCLFVAGCLAGITYNGVTEHLPNSNISTVWSLGFAAVQPQTLLRYLTTYRLIAMVLLSNTPQIILSILYYLINSVLTRMLMAAEYNSYSIRRKPLRVSWPEGLQRSTYFLALPYRYSVPLMVISALLHSLLSLSISYVRIVQYDQFGVVDESKTISTCNLSPIAMIFTLSLAGLALALLIGLGLTRFPTRMPLAGNCSLAISAACHPPMGDENAALKPIMWGEISLYAAGDRNRTLMAEPAQLMSEEANESAEEEVLVLRNMDSVISHCCFTSMDVVEPVSSRRYV